MKEQSESCGILAKEIPETKMDSIALLCCFYFYQAFRNKTHSTTQPAEHDKSRRRNDTTVPTLANSPCYETNVPEIRITW